MPSALLEIGLEEVPARFVDQCLLDIKNNLLKGLEAARLTSKDTRIDSMGTYRRFGFVIHDVLNEQPDIDDVMDGPPIQIAKSESGEWLAPAIGFAKKCDVNVDDLVEGKNAKGAPIVQAKRFQKGQLTTVLLSAIFKNAITQMKLPIAMVWGNNNGPFIRPVKWVCSLFEGDVVDLELFGVPSGNLSFGHRFLTPSKDHGLGEAIIINHPNNYSDALMKGQVIVNVDDRRSTIKSQLMDTIEDIDSSLLNEVVQLVEWPTVLSISFSDDFLTLPKEVLIECLKKHQKAFIVTNNGAVCNSCMVVADSVTNHNKETIILGNQRVMLARLNDVQFFWSEDLKSASFSNWNEALASIVFQEGLGSMADKVNRMTALAHVVLDQHQSDAALRDTVLQAVANSKADLVSQMVTELPSLQGMMGAYYANAFNEDDNVSLAIRDQYHPRFEGDEFPGSLAGAILSIVDRLDTMVGCFENNAIPTGSRDPWGIRRSMIAIMKMVIHFKINININELLVHATQGYNKTFGENAEKCKVFFKKRIETVLLDRGMSHDLIQWVMPNILDEPMACIEKATKLSELKQQSPDRYQLIVETTGRVSKIIDGFNGECNISDQLFEHHIETEAYHSFQQLKEKNNCLILNAETLNDTVLFCETLSSYFDAVLINADNERVAQNRRSFIKSVNDYFFNAGDWLKLQK